MLETWCVEPTTAVEEHIQLWTVVRLQLSKIVILPTMTGVAVPQAILVTLERETATPTVSVPETWCVEPTTAVEEHTQLWTVVWLQLMKIAILPTMTGVAAPQAILVVLEKETATLTVSASEAWCVEPTTVVAEHIQHWTVVRLLPRDPCASHFI